MSKTFKFFKFLILCAASILRSIFAFRVFEEALFKLYLLAAYCQLFLKSFLIFFILKRLT